MTNDHPSGCPNHDTVPAPLHHLEELVASLRAELCLAYDVIDSVPQAALAAVPDHKLLACMRGMKDAEKHEHVRDRFGQLVEQLKEARILLAISPQDTNKALLQRRRDFLLRTGHLR